MLQELNEAMFIHLCYADPYPVKMGAPYVVQVKQQLVVKLSRYSWETAQCREYYLFKALNDRTR